MPWQAAKGRGLGHREVEGSDRPANGEMAIEEAFCVLSVSGGR
jgi:hypothetical protein